MTPSSAPGTARAVRAIVFDLDGTLIDSYAAIAASLNHARAGWDLPPLDDAVVRLAVGHGLESLIADHCGAERIEAGVARFREHYARVFLDLTTVLPGVTETLAALTERRVALAVASNKPARFTAPILDHFGLGRFVGSVHGPDTVGRTKPDPVMIRTCLDDLGVRAEDALYVGDMVLDVESGSRAGVDVVLVPGGSSPPDELRATGVPVLARFEDLVDLLPAHDTGGTRG